MRSAPVLRIILSTALGLCSGLSAAAHPERNEGLSRQDVGIRFMGKDPVGPLALVKHGALVQVPRSACREWGSIGSRWAELDEYGHIVGETAVLRGGYYDVSKCDELSLKLVQGRLGAGVRVAVDASYIEPDFRPFRASAKVRHALENYANQAQSRITPEIAEERAIKVPFSRRVLYFTDRKNHTWAAIGGKTLLVERWNGKDWVREYEQHCDSNHLTERAFLPFAVTDMNRDGQPEVVVRREEGMGEFYGDFVISRAAGAKWQDRGWGIFGSTA